MGGRSRPSGCERLLVTALSAGVLARAPRLLSSALNLQEAARSADGNWLVSCLGSPDGALLLENKPVCEAGFEDQRLIFKACCPAPAHKWYLTGVRYG